MAKDIVLVTGGAGYIGSVLVKKLLEKGEKVRVVDKLYFGDSALADIRGKIELKAGDVRQFDPDLLDGVKCVMHLGSLSNDPTAEFDPKANKEINFEGTMRVAEACKRKGVKKFTFASSCAIYGFHVDDIADEDHSTNPQSEYSQSKLDAENGLRSLVSAAFCPVMLRQATVFGFSNRMRWDLVANTMTKDAFASDRIHVYCAGDNWRPLVDVNDVAEAHIAMMQAPDDKVKGQVFNLVHKNYRILELGHWIAEIIKPKQKIEVNVLFGSKESRSYRVAGDKISQVTGFEPKVTVEDAVRSIWQVLHSGRYTDFTNPIYYNIEWMKLLVDMEQKLKLIGKVF
ncbi:MAG: SDR family oxidoreductase [Candidatus Saganbacteria bacterium]|nr:SDR family oxidoreductase [Candidatus Saganbacteria bacterium]